MVGRRVFLSQGGLAAIGLSMVPGFLCRSLEAAEQGTRRKTLVVVFQRGGADGLNMVVPFGDKAYYDHRPTIAVPQPGRGTDAALDLDGFFGLHPALRPLAPPHQEGRLGIIHAGGPPHTGPRPHFAAHATLASAAARVTTGY